MAELRQAHWITRSGHEGQVGDREARFAYWSFTKTVIAALALDLADRGKLDLDDSVPGATYTLRHLLQHNSGLPDYGTLPAYHQAVTAGETPWPRDEMIARTLAQGRLFEPGDGWAYSNLGYTLAVAQIEAVACRPLSDLIQDRLALPLGLTHLRLAQSPEDFNASPWRVRSPYDPAWVYHGCLVGTAGEAARLLHAILHGPLLSEAARTQMCDALPLGGAVTGRPWRSHGYGLGLMIGTFATLGRAMGHGGTGPFSVASVLHFPDRDDPLTVACFAQGQDDGVTEWTVAEIAAATQTRP